MGARVNLRQIVPGSLVCGAGTGVGSSAYKQPNVGTFDWWLPPSELAVCVFAEEESRVELRWCLCLARQGLGWFTSHSLQLVEDDSG